MRYLCLLLFVLFGSYINVAGQITGVPTVCEGSTTALACTTPVGGTWSSSNLSVAVVGSSGVVTGIAMGTTVITYESFPVVHTIVVSVNPLPVPITASTFVICVGGSVALSSSPTGGTWSSGDVPVAAVGSSSGVVSGLAAGITSIHYFAPLTGCATFVTITINASPAAITGPSTVCVNSNITLADITPSGTWSTSNAVVATVGSTGIVTGLASGTTQISYRLASGCQVVKTITVNPIPSPITGNLNVCSGLFTTLSSGPAAGAWSASGPATSVHPVTGVVTGMAAGTGNISYTLSTSGCFRTAVVTVHAMPGAIVGSPTTCIGTITTLGNATPGGTWVSSNLAVATLTAGVSSSTVVSGIAAGTSIVSYLTAPMCVSSVVVTVNPPTSAGTLSGTDVICQGATTTLISTVAGGTWSVVPVSIASVGTASGIVSGLAPGVASVIYTVGGMCGPASASMTVTVNISPSTIVGASLICEGFSVPFTNAVSGGIWSAGAPSVATIGSSTGIVYGVNDGTTTITYMIGSCYATQAVTINPSPAPIVGPGNVCVGDAITLTNVTTGGTWGSSDPSVAVVATIGSTTGVVSGMTAGTTTITYTLGMCYSIIVIGVNPQPVVTVTAIADPCGGSYTISAAGAATYVWSPIAGLSCGMCPVATTIPTSTTSYTVTGTDGAGCSNTAAVTVNGDRIFGHITFSAFTPTLKDVEVWLIQYNPADSSLIAIDSTSTCLDGSVPYYQFDAKPSGSYFVKAKHLSSTPGNNSFVTTYGGTTANWVNATTVNHSGNADLLDIEMIYGTVPSGPGYINGYIYSGSGVTGDVPASGMLVLLRDAITGRVLSHTYTNAGGGYSFGALPFGSYVVYPEEYDFYTTPAAMITLSPTNVSAVDVTFKRHTGLLTIYPYVYTGTDIVTAEGSGALIFPNPSNVFVHLQWKGHSNVTLSVIDVSGRIVLNRSLTLNDAQPETIDIDELQPGMYFLHLSSGDSHTHQKLVITRR